MSQPRVAVVGGGIAGTFASLVLRSRGVRPVLFDAAGSAASGGASSSPSSPPSDGDPLVARVGSHYQFLRSSSDPRLSSLLHTFEREGFISRWDGARFGMLGSRGGGFLTADVVAGSGVGSMGRSNTGGGEGEGGESGEALQDDTNGKGHGGATDAGDYCSFVSTYGPDVATYVGTPHADALCPSILSRANIDAPVEGLTVVGARMLPEGGWGLHVTDKADGGGVVDDLGGEKFDALVLAGHESTVLASKIVWSIASAEAEAALASGGPLGPPPNGAAMDVDAAVNGAAAPTIADRLHNLANDLETIAHGGRMPVYTLSALYPPGFASGAPFDAAAVPGSHLVQFLARDGSKPGRGVVSGGNPQSADGEGGGEVWTAVSTSAFASSVLSDSTIPDGERTTRAAAALAEEVSRLLSPYMGAGPMLSEPTAMRARLGRYAFAPRTLGLHEECVSLAPWRLAICGDFVRGAASGVGGGGGDKDAAPGRSGPFETEAISGLDAGERTAAFFASS